MQFEVIFRRITCGWTTNLEVRMMTILKHKRATNIFLGLGSVIGIKYFRSAVQTAFL